MLVLGRFSLSSPGAQKLLLLMVKQSQLDLLGVSYLVLPQVCAVCVLVLVHRWGD